MFKELLSTPGGALTFIRTIEILAFFTVFALMILNAVPVFVSDTNTTMHMTTQQTAFVERLSKDTLIMASSTTPSDQKAQALSELQVTLPVFEANQKSLQVTSLTATGEDLLLDSQAPYANIDKAARIIIANPKNTILVSSEASITTLMEREYFIDLSQITNTLQQQASNSRYTLFVLTELVCLILVIIKTIFVLSIEDAAKRYKKLQEAHQEMPEKTEKQ